MKTHSRTWPVPTVKARKKKIDPKPQYQRGLVWSLSQKQLLIDSILRGYDIPKLYLRKIDNPDYDWEVVDGQQRLRAIWDFLENNYAVSEDSDPVDGHEVAGKVYEDLHYGIKEDLDAYTLDVVVIEEAEDQEIDDLFLRFQNGVPLNSAEKRNAISGNMRDFICKTALEHNLMTRSVAFSSRRYSHDEVVAQMMLMEIHGGITTVRTAQLKEMYKTYKNFKTNPSAANAAKRLKKVMNFLAKAFPQKCPDLTKGNLLSLYIVASESMGKYAIADRAREFGEWFVKFEQQRKLDEDKPEDEREERMVSYQMAVSQQTASATSLGKRREILTEDLFEVMSDIVLLDDQRQFTHDQRTAIYRKTNGRCANPDNNPRCVDECQWDNFHADHIIPHSKGGKTTVENGQLLCPSCNLKKSNR